ncbi:hypothetical protein MLD38_015281 [Melastoma candidum]|uniref:Uncharacterized protein n=1 Tax=Melastoma candidum TaxID=119954 RepID=A0ACB9RFQ7_9MYRT|nr:hypothetical protein MLD38_015281 [Melastoma candidum]
MFWDPIVRKATRFWNAWDIETIVLLSILLQIILMIFGSCRRYTRGFWIRTSVWSSYLLAGWVATVGIGKLSDLNVVNPGIPHVGITLKALLAPLLLLHLGSPDTITAYSIQDNELGVREIFQAIIQVGVVIWILVRSWTYTKLSFLTLPMFAVGFIKYGERAWALKSALKEDVHINTDLVADVDIKHLLQFRNLLRDPPGVDLILKAHYRFEHLKPHLENWLYHPLFITTPAMTVDQYSAEDIFKITEIELGLMYDALYTKAPIVFTRVGLILRCLSLFGMIITFSGFMLVYSNPLLDERNVAFTFSVLSVAIVLELYSDVRLLSSERAIAWMIRHRHTHKMKKLLQFMICLSLRKRRWSNHLPQFNLVSFCLKGNVESMMTRMLRCCRFEEEWKKHMFTAYNKPDVLALLQSHILEQIHAVEQQRGIRPFTKRGEWALERYEVKEDCVTSSIKTEFGRSIAIWHIATTICYNLDVSSPRPYKNISKWISDYMMHLLVNQPYMLHVASGNAIYGHFCGLVKDLFEGRTADKKDEVSACQYLLETELLERVGENRRYDPVVELKWHVLPNARELSVELMRRDDRWALVGSVWGEMLCYAAYECRLESHAAQMRRGGEFITLVWLLLSHKTDRFNYGKCG